MDNNNKMAGGLLLGLAIGTIAGALLSPRTGAENRAMLQEKLNQVSDTVRKNRRRLQSEIEGALPSRESDFLP